MKLRDEQENTGGRIFVCSALFCRALTCPLPAEMRLDQLREKGW